MGKGSAAVPGESRRFRSVLRSLAVASAFLAGSAAAAQVAPTREEIQRPPLEADQPPAARLTVEGGIERAPCALDRPEYQAIRLTVTGVEFADLRGLNADDLRPAYASYLGQEHPIAVICEIRDRAATILRDAGYVAAVEVPEQRIIDGHIRFQVLMAKLVGLRVRGNAGRSERAIARYLERLTQRDVFNRYEAERYLLLAGDLPGLDVRLALRSAGAARGEVIGEVTVVRRAAQADVAIQNLGSRELGRWGAMVRGQVFGLTGLGDRTTIAVFTTADTSEQQTLQIAHDFRVGSEGLAFGGQLTYAWASPDLDLPGVEIDSQTLYATLEASYPFVRRQALTLRGALGLDIIDQDIVFNGIPLNRDRMRIAFVRADLDAVGLVPGNPQYTLTAPRWRLSANAELRRGLDIFGAFDGCGTGLIGCLAPNVVPPTRLEGDPDAFVVRGGLYGEFRPVPNFTIAIGARGQWASDSLFSFEEFSAGNYTAGRGYDPGALLGDSGIGLQAELRYGNTVPAGPKDLAFEPYVFFDQAWVWNEDVLFAMPRQEVSSIGGGIRAVYGDRFRIDVLLAEPLDRTPLQTRRGDTRLLVTLTARLWPWRSR
ncbi:MAG TPA: ShlB/FhaC/HecB family hemolysin secretion/activation protein [Allosphingosinicella sp.]|nr:ShlB/FhaC/HecB family hemolysin secretion/activation protein [Allosphingosinicella sp.]